MRTVPWYLAAFFLVLLGSTSFAQVQSSGQDKSLGEVARELRAKKQNQGGSSAIPVAAAPAAPTTKPAAPAAQPGTTVVADPPEIAEFMRSVDLQVYRRDFAQLDKMADEARSSKARFPGGGWKLSTFYVEVGTVREGANATDADWQRHLGFFQSWVAARPKSITARVALADAYLRYGWQARGDGYSDQVSAEGWRLFQERVGKAAGTLIDAAQLEAKCPQWFVEFQIVGRAMGIDKQQMQALFDKAVAFEPDYFYIYQQQAIWLLPQWGGDPGETEAFAEESYRQLGGEKGAILYFQIATKLCGECGYFNPQLLSWPQLQEGFAALERSYGLTPYWLNQYARMAVAFQDKDAAAKAFARIGDNWDQSAWGSRAQFDTHRAWAGLAPVVKPAQKPAFFLDGPGTQQINQLLATARQAAAEERWNDSDQALRQLIDGAKPFPQTDYWLEQAYFMLAVNQQRQGRPDEAQSVLDEEVTVITQRNGADSTDVANALDARGVLEEQRKDDKHEEADLRRAIAIRQKANVPAFQLPIEVHQLAMLYRRHRRYHDAVNLLQPFIPAQVNPDPTQEKNLPLVLEAMGTIYQDMGRLPEAETAYVRMARILEATLPVNSIGLVDPLSKLASLYHAMGKESEAQQIEKKLEEIQQTPAQPN